MVVLPSTGDSRYHNRCICGGNSAKYFGYTLTMYGPENVKLAVTEGPPKGGIYSKWEVRAATGSSTAKLR
jgi:hypothetical protein